MMPDGSETPQAGGMGHAELVAMLFGECGAASPLSGHDGVHRSERSINSPERRGMERPPRFVEGCSADLFSP